MSEWQLVLVKRLVLLHGVLVWGLPVLKQQHVPVKGSDLLQGGVKAPRLRCGFVVGLCMLGGSVVALSPFLSNFMVASS